MEQKQAVWSYDRLTAECLVSGRRVASTEEDGVYVLEVIAAFLKHAKSQDRPGFFSPAATTIAFSRFGT
jgi:hypothetical protein